METTASISSAKQAESCNGNHARTRHHHFPHQGVSQGENPLEDGAFIRFQVGDGIVFNQAFQLSRG
jgi:hypothetical protein